jgi:hypothetical protein
MIWSLDKNKIFDGFDLLPWFEISRSWSQKNRHETIYYRVFIFEWLGYRLEILKEVNSW